MYTEPDCATVTFSGFGNTDPYGQSYEGMTLKKTCSYVNDQVTFWKSSRTHYVYYCDKYQDWRLALSNNDLSDCQAFAKTPQGSGKEWNTFWTWFEWNTYRWQFSSGSVTCDTTAFNITCGEPSVEVIGLGRIITIMVNILVIFCALACCAFFCIRYYRKRNRMTESSLGLPEYPRTPYNPEVYSSTEVDRHNQKPFAAIHNQQYAAEQRAEGEIEGQVEGGTAGVSASAPPPPAYNSAPPAYNSEPPAYNSGRPAYY